MSHSSSSTTLTRRTMLTSSAAVLAATGLSFGLPGSATATVSAGSASGGHNHALCAAHHKELSAHLSQILNSSYVDARMKNKLLTTSNCPHCKTAIAPDMMNQAAFAAL